MQLYADQVQLLCQQLKDTCGPDLKPQAGEQISAHANACPLYELCVTSPRLLEAYGTKPCDAADATRITLDTCITP